MKTLLILRHAKSSWNHPELSDHERPLNKRGKRDAPRMGELLRAEGLIPDIIMSSTARRARETAERVIDASGFDGQTLLIPEFYHGSYETMLELLRELPDDAECVMIVGHNPDLEEFIESLTDDYTPLSTASLAKIEVPILRWKELRETMTGKLVNVWNPSRP
jgi:phosphohistidine phosphatase